MTAAPADAAAPPFRIARTHSAWRKQWGGLRKRVLALRHGRAPFVARYLGARFRCDLADGVAKGIAANTYDHRQLAFLEGWARRERPDRFLDIGANLGLYSCVLVAGGAVPRATAFEPDARNRDALAGSVALNGLAQRVTIEPCALGAAAGEAWLDEGPAANRGTSRLADEREGAGSGAVRRYRVPVRRLDDLLDAHGETLLVKIDVEGREVGVLEGMARTLAANRCLVQVEAFDDAHARLLEGAGYRFLGSIANDRFWLGGRAR